MFFVFMIVIWVCVIVLIFGVGWVVFGNGYWGEFRCCCGCDCWR